MGWPGSMSNGGGFAIRKYGLGARFGCWVATAGGVQNRNIFLGKYESIGDVGDEGNMLVMCRPVLHNSRVYFSLLIVNLLPN